MERLSMRNIKEVLRLKHEAGCGNRDIAKSCGIGRTTVSHYLRQAARAGLSWPSPPDWMRRSLSSCVFHFHPYRLRIFARNLTGPRSIKS
ncbi:hypothetical protein DFAR_950029 [Desulfarculales bacterium]